jgi:hypothetical protein
MRCGIVDDAPPFCPVLPSWVAKCSRAADSPFGIDPLFCSRVPAYALQKTAKSWRVLIMRHRGEHLGTVEAHDRERAEVVAVKLFDLNHDQRRRLLIRERL